jgi:SAM-dependent methyltransferase
MNRRQYFDQRAALGNHHYDPRIAALVNDRIVPLFKLKPGRPVLNIGCGTGTLLPLLRSRAGGKASITGLDFSARMLERARETADPSVTFVRANAQDMPFPTCTFDAVVSLDAFSHFPDKLAALTESRRVLTDGGKMIIAHTGGLREVNARNRRSGGPVAGDVLPPDEVMMNLLTKARFVKMKILSGKEFHYIEAFKPRDGELPSAKPAAIRRVACAQCCHCGGCAGRLL